MLRPFPPLLRVALLALSTLLLGLAAAGGPGSARAQIQGEDRPVSVSEPFSVTLARWQRALDSIDQYLDRPSQSAVARTAELRQEAAAVRNQALEIRTTAQAQIETQERLLAALGDPPEEGAPAEPANVAEARRQYRDALAVFRSRASLSELIATRADELDRRLAQLQRDSTISRLTQRGPVPLAPSTIQEAVPDFLAGLGRLATIPYAWWSDLPAEQRRPEPYLRLGAFLLGAVLVGWLVRRLILARFGRDPKTDQPAYARRLLGAIAEGVAQGIVPGSILALFFVLVVTGRTPFSGAMTELMAVLSGVVMVFVMAVAMIGAVFAPDLPSWRLVSLSRENARTIGRRLWLLSGLFAIDVVLTATADVAAVSPELRSFYGLAAGVLLGGTLLSLSARSLWQPVEGAIPDEPRFDETPPPETPDVDTVGFWGWVRRFSMAAVVVGIGALLIGYTNLGSFLIDSLLLSFLIIGALGLVRGLLRESVGVLTGSALVRQRLGLTSSTRRQIKFWLRAALDPLLLLAAVLLVAPVWGVPVNDMAQWLIRVFSGFTIGNVTISISDILLGILVFGAIVFGIRLMQRGLSDRILPETTLDQGLQHSLSQGFGYIGLIVAVAIGITVMGLDLSTLAIIAGALSVGIGFGLRDVVNNFVCGLILLIERPIKVGDWVVVGPNEGFVKRINLRATEIETWQRAAVILPNAAIIGNPMTNWTHKDKYGRVDVQVRVAYGSDLDRVEEILLHAARHHPRLLLQPEPYVLLRDFAEYGFFYELRAYTGDVIWTIVIASELRREIDRNFREAGIVIPYPQQTLHWGTRGEGANAVPAELPGAEPIGPANPPRPRVIRGGGGQEDGDDR